MPCRTTPNLIPFTVMQTGLVPNVIGPPGCAKTKTIEAFAKALNRQLHTLIGSLDQPEDFGCPYPIHKEETPYLAMMPPKWAVDCCTGFWVLFSDELTCQAPAVQAKNLSLIAENRVGDHRLPKSVWQIAACNPPDCAANGSELEPPMANRLGHWPWEMDDEAWHRGMANGLNFPTPQFTLLPPDWEKHIGRNAAMIGAFHRHRPGLLDAYPKERAKASGPWPSRRSWTNASIGMAALEAIDAEPLLRYRCVAGFVGEEAALEFQTWEANLDLPNREAWIAAALDARSRGVPLSLAMPPRCDQIMAVLAALVDAVKNHNLGPDGKPTQDRWLAAVDCFAAVSDTWLEPAIAAAGPLYFAVPHASVLVKAPADFSNRVLEVHRNISAAA